MPHLEPLTIVVFGKHDSGKTTVASLVKMCLEESGFSRVTMMDAPPLPQEQKEDFSKRLAHNRQRVIRIVVELEEP